MQIGLLYLKYKAKRKKKFFLLISDYFIKFSLVKIMSAKLILMSFLQVKSN